MQSNLRKNQKTRTTSIQKHFKPRRRISRFYNHAAIVKLSRSLLTEKKKAQKFYSVRIKIEKSRFYKIFKKLKFQTYKNRLVKMIWKINTSKLSKKPRQQLSTASLRQTSDTIKNITFIKQQVKRQHHSWTTQLKQTKKLNSLFPVKKKSKTTDTPFIWIFKSKKRLIRFNWKLRSHAFRKIKRSSKKLLNRLSYSNYRKINQTLPLNYFKYYSNEYRKLNLRTRSKRLVTKQLLIKALLRGPLFLKNLATYCNPSLQINSWWATALFSSNKVLKNFTLLLQAVKNKTNQKKTSVLTRFKLSQTVRIRRTRVQIVPKYNPREVNNVGYMWTKVNQPFSFTRPMNRLTQNQFWDYLESAKSKPLTHPSFNFELLFCVNWINQTLRTVVLLNQLRNPYFFTTYWKTLLLNETLTQSSAIPSFSLTTISNSACVNKLKSNTLFSYYGLNFNLLKKNTHQSVSLDNVTDYRQQHFYNYVQSINNKKTLLITNQTLVLPFKNSYQHTKTHLGLIQNQLVINRISSLAAYDRIMGQLKLKPTIFTYKWWTHHYRSHEILIARADGRGYYWNTGEESNTLHTHHMLSQTPFVLNWNWNENLWENTLHICTSNEDINNLESVTLAAGAHVVNDVISRFLSNNLTGSNDQADVKELRSKQTKINALINYLQHNFKSKTTTIDDRLHKILLLKIKKHLTLKNTLNHMLHTSHVGFKFRFWPWLKRKFGYSILHSKFKITNWFFLHRYYFVKKVLKKLIFFISSKSLKKNSFHYKTQKNINYQKSYLKNKDK